MASGPPEAWRDARRDERQDDRHEGWRERGRFLFRSEEGAVGAPVWRFHAAWLVALLLVLTAVWVALRPYTRHDLATSAFIAPLTVLAFAYLIAYSFAVLVIAICYTMLTIKRLRDRALPVGLATLVPLLGLLAASLHFLRKQTPDAVALPYVVVLDAVLLAAVVWTVADLGFRRGRRDPVQD